MQSAFHIVIRCILLVVLMPAGATYAQTAASPLIPGCTCSAGIEIENPAAPADKKTYAANCICGPQFCATTWNDDIALQCIGGAAGAGPRPNCADFTGMKAGKYGDEMTAGLFHVAALPSQKVPPLELEVRFDEIATVPPIDGPNGLHTARGSSFTYPAPFKRAEIALATYMGGGNYLTILTGKNALEKVPYSPDPVPGKTINLTVQHADGIKQIRFPENEVLVFEVCAVE
ncbi:MAG: hypothetical protein DI595_09870 [Agrobacterium fabrum]|uniref:Uncharacterized protein n=1 Tax=Agrobacterium fabrum TaxID=1176649 RepID=A0A2W5FBJ7_9HYPH|nr:MAG: hypothetical protein DI595_09870 [Agrobacterium fabrum]